MTVATNAVQNEKLRILLVSAPWPLFNRPSLPVGALKAYLGEQIPHLEVVASHLFLDVAQALGYARYQAISSRVWRAESVFSALLYPRQASRAESLYRGTLKRNDDAPRDFADIVRTVKTASAQWLGKIDWHALDLVGFSISFCQTTASLYLISRIKSIRPDLPVVVGGSSFSGQAASSLLPVFPQIDYVVVGEGEKPMAGLVNHLQAVRKGRSPSLPPGILHAGNPHAPLPPFNQLDRMDRLPVPDYDDYFNRLGQLPPGERFFATLPIEASRGCWWNQKESGGHFNGCAFCNLNLQWRGYRTKSPTQLAREVDLLVQRYQVLSLAFADNALPPKKAEAMMDVLGNLGHELSIFAELRAKTPPATLHKMRMTGVDAVQVGIEALSSRLLKKMNKGTRAIDNLNMMKQCEGRGIINLSNLIVHFPSSDEKDVGETLSVLDFVIWYRPLKIVRFWLGLDSPIHRFARQFNVRAVFNHPNLRKLFPAAVADGMRFMIQGYRGDRQRQRRLWRPVEIKVRQWVKAYAQLQQQTGGGPAILSREGGQFLIIDQHWPDRPTDKHRLTGVSAGIYRHCQVPHSLDQIVEAFPSHGRETIERFLQSLVAKRLMFAENDHYLSLAVPVSWRS
ncbi:hypothetical protein DSCO28_05900 [Desulfosarcina ovata subsp. sediminis]|uniref:B12-binding domain-containing protein n=1 Tax=Desulfosarcina ovata subsp. sediminis TaxID=885957 RepID=A0A5K7ZFF1_9BACT|nr:RiPP maturation radical SAM C-methyltransferase [Desulfosarcina ovata]BBO80024.1 hypothetical protein DSCO28_05900 [Desulfosarcina ovata subsp. sediminis]